MRKIDNRQKVNVVPKRKKELLLFKKVKSRLKSDRRK